MDEPNRCSNRRAVAALILGAGLTAIGVAGGLSEVTSEPTGSRALVTCPVSAVADPAGGSDASGC